MLMYLAYHAKQEYQTKILLAALGIFVFQILKQVWEQPKCWAFLTVVAHSLIEALSKETSLWDHRRPSGNLSQTNAWLSFSFGDGM